MSIIKNKFSSILGIALFAVISIMAGCKKEDAPEPKKTVYDLKVKDQLGVSGTVTFTETSSTITTIEISLTGGSSDNHPAHIHANSAVEGGSITISLNPVVNGKSSTQVSKLDDNSAINYSQLIAYDGYLNVHQSANNLSTIIAQTDIGGNELAGPNVTYNLDAAGASGVSGTAIFEKRKNGNTLISINLNGTLANGIHPAAIHIGSVATVGGGPVVKTLNAVNGATGKSYTNMRTLNDGTPINYDNVLVYDGYLAVHESELLMANVLCQGDIGSN